MMKTLIEVSLMEDGTLDAAWLEEEWDEFLSKPNRRKEQERKAHDLVQGGAVPDGLHQPRKKDWERRKVQAIRKAARG